MEGLMMIVSYCLSFLMLSVLCGWSACFIYIGLPRDLTSQGMLFLKR